MTSLGDLSAQAGVGPVIALLDRWVPRDPQQASFREQMLALARARADALERTSPDAHFTGSAMVVNERRDASLLIFHNKLQLWLQPGGHADGDANLARVALREAVEETGIATLRWERYLDLDIHQVAPPRERPHDHYDVRSLVIAPEGSIPAANDEVQRFRWIPLAELAADPSYDSSLRRMARRCLEPG